MTAENPLLQLATWYGYAALASLFAAGGAIILRDLDGNYRRRAKWTSQAEMLAITGAVLGLVSLGLLWTTG